MSNFDITYVVVELKLKLLKYTKHEALPLLDYFDFDLWENLIEKQIPVKTDPDTFEYHSECEEQ
jgi:hypothetical protein